MATPRTFIAQADPSTCTETEMVSTSGESAKPASEYFFPLSKF